MSLPVVRIGTSLTSFEGHQEIVDTLVELLNTLVKNVAFIRHVVLTNTMLLERLDYLLDIGLMFNVVELKSPRNRVCSQSDAGEIYDSALLRPLVV